MNATARILILLPFLTACGEARPAPQENTRPLVIATIYPVASVARAVAGDAARVASLVPPGAHPDTYQTSPRDAELMAGAHLLVRVGGAADAWLGDAGGLPSVVFTEGMELQGEAPHGTGSAAHGTGSAARGTGNPHVWLDPIRVRDSLLPPLTEALAEVAPDSAAAIRSRAAAFADSLTGLDAEIRAMLRDAPTRRFISAHPAWVYFAERYDLEPVGVLHPSPGQEIGTRALAGLVEAARDRGVRAVLAEPQLGRAAVDALSAEIDARVEIADPTGGANVEGRTDYLSLMRFNGRAFARALGAGSP